jgi:hypothetical protein
MGFFDFNNPQHRELAEAHQNGNYNQLDPQQVASTYQGFVNHGPEKEVQQVHQDYFNQMPQVERMGLFSSLIDTVKQNGIDPRQAGVSTTDPHQASPLDLGNLFNLARSSGLLDGLFGGGTSQSGLGALAGSLIGNQSGYNNQQPNPANNQQPGNQDTGPLAGIGNILRNPMAQAALGGLISFAASRAFGGNAQPATQSQPAGQTPSAQSLPYQPGPSGQNQPAQPDPQSSGLPPAPQTDQRM